MTHSIQQQHGDGSKIQRCENRLLHSSSIYDCLLLFVWIGMLCWGGQLKLSVELVKQLSAVLNPFKQKNELSKVIAVIQIQSPHSGERLHSRLLKDHQDRVYASQGGFHFVPYRFHVSFFSLSSGTWNSNSCGLMLTQILVQQFIHSAPA